MRTALLALVLLLGGCVSARDCVDKIPEGVRADTLRLVLDKGMLQASEMPRADRQLALDSGTPLAEMSRERQQELSRHAVGYAHCVREIVRKGR